MSSYLTFLQSLYDLTQKKHQVMGLDSFKELLQKIGKPQLCYPVILVAGSNGKGSASLKIAETLRLSGYKVGLYTSPHLSCFRERIRINQTMIAEQDLLNTYASIPFSQEHSFFERTTATAFQYFANNHVDIAVIEVGLGGRLDATNCCSPMLSVITSISLEHTEILGDTLNAIAKEKLGISRVNIPLVVGPTFPNIPIDPAIPLYRVSCAEVNYDAQNQAVAKQSLELLKNSFKISEEAMQEGLNKRPSCRMEKIPPRYILDVAHNPAGMRALSESITPKVVLLGLSRRKEAFETWKAAHLFKCPILLFAGKHPRCLTQEELNSLTEGSQPIYSCFEEALLRIEDKNNVLITGSCFIMAEVRKQLEIIEDYDPFDLNEKIMPNFLRGLQN